MNTRDKEIITAKPDDLHIVRDITHTTINTIYPHYYPEGAVQFFLDHHSDEHITADISCGKVFVLYEDGNPAGTVTISDNNINRLFVLPKYQRKGYGKALLDFAEKKILESYEFVQIDASFPAKQIYRKRGYRETEYNIIETDNGDCLCFDVMKLEKTDGSCVIRRLRENETELLKDFLYEAIFIPEGVEPPEREIIEQPELKLYYESFGTGKADFSFVAEVDGKVTGAVWTRIMNDYGHVDDETPSFAISLYKEYRGHGIGTKLMKEMLALLREKGYKRASLAVQKANYAVKMYNNVGFKTVDENAEEYIMVCEL